MIKFGNITDVEIEGATGSLLPMCHDCTDGPAASGTHSTFILATPDAGIRLYKIPSTPQHPPAAVQAGLRQMSAGRGSSMSAFLDGCDLIVLGPAIIREETTAIVVFPGW